MDNKYIEVFPDKIKLSKTFEQNFYESRITLTNLTNLYVVFKVYINKNTIYSANPSSSFIKPKESTTITIKRLEKEADKEIKSSSDKFLIIAFPTNNVINSNAEAKALLTETNMKLKNNQELFLVVEYDNKQSQEQPLRNTIANTSTPNIDDTSSKKQFDSGDTIEQTTEQMSTEAELEETRRLIEETKKKIGQMDSQISILDNQLNNYGKYSGLHQRKSKVLSINEKETPISTNSYPMSATIFLATFGLVLGAYLNKLISGLY